VTGRFIGTQWTHLKAYTYFQGVLLRTRHLIFFPASNEWFSICTHIRREGKAFKERSMDDMDALHIRMDSRRRWNHCLQGSFGILDLKVRSAGFCSNCVGEFDHGGQVFRWVLHTKKKPPSSSRRMSPQSSESTAYWSRNKGDSRTG
jgi:hypothetical protein